MKKAFAAVLAVFLSVFSFTTVAMAATQAADGLSGSKTTSYANVTDSSNATVTLVSGVAGQYITFYRYTISNSTADNFYLRCGSTQVTGTIWLAATSGLDAILYPFYIRCGSGEALSLVKGTGSTPVGVNLWFTQQP